MENWNSDYPPSLSLLFEPDDGYRGEFGWICGYSADSDFLNAAAERFSGCTKAQRARWGRTFLAAMLDPGNPQIVPNETPGVVHLPCLKARNELPFELLHAKVAILGFRSDDSSGKSRTVRLIVSTGNWTRDTLQESLDLVWVAEIEAGKGKNSSPAEKQCCADIGAAWDFMSFVKGFFDDGLLAAVSKRGESMCREAMRGLEDCIGPIRSSGKGATPRFFDNRKQSLLSRLETLVVEHAGQSRRNYICMGSGFYETADTGGKNRIPSVPSRIVETLREKGLLTETSGKDVFVNKEACQAVADNFKAMTDDGWNVRHAADPMGRQRKFHAKFVFSASYRGNSDYGNSGWLYLGSGNLTNPGFLSRMKPDGGNLEAGILTGVDRVTDEELSRLLPVQWNTAVATIDEICSGEPWKERETRFLAAPVSCFLYLEDAENMGLLEPATAIEEKIQVVGPEGNPCPENDAKRFLWKGKPPLAVKVRWGNDGHINETFVPVMDEFGRICALPMDKMDIEEAWTQLSDFPAFGLYEEDGEEDDMAQKINPLDENPEKADPVWRNGASSVPSEYEFKYPIRSMMRFVENIATRQDAVFSEDWKLWCNRVEQALVASKDSAAVIYCREIGLNVLGPLWQAPFRPDFAKDGESEAGRHYESMLNRISDSWGTSGLPLLGGEK